MTSATKETTVLAFHATSDSNPASIHHGMKVRSGVKHIITKWYRERPWG